MHKALSPTDILNTHLPMEKSDITKIQTTGYWQRPSEYDWGHCRHVLLVQRRIVERRVMSEMLNALGYRVTQVDDGGKALVNFGREPCDVVISFKPTQRFLGAHDSRIQVVLTRRIMEFSQF